MKRALFVGFSLYFLTVLVGFLVYGILSKGLPSMSVIETFRPPLATYVYARNGEQIYQFFVERREPVSIDRVPSNLLNAFISLEDRRFWKHWGLDILRIMKAFEVNLRMRRVVQGASTITQQLARNMFLNQKRTITRKLKEAILAIRIERAFSKEEILEKYLNQIYFGHGGYGVQAASHFYFGKDVSDLDLAECALLAGIPRSPLLYSPFRDSISAKRRRNVVLRVMKKQGWITDSAYKAALKEPLHLAEGPKKKEFPQFAPYFIEMVRRYVLERYGEDFLYEMGGKIYTTLDVDLQRKAEAVLDSMLTFYEDFYHISPKKRDYKPDSLNPPKYLQGALLTLDPHTGEVLSLVGGRDFKHSQFNRVTQLFRQPGSAFKLFVYTAAIDNGYRPSEITYDIPFLSKQLTPEEGWWFPENFDNRFLGPITLRKALALSRNLATVHVAEEVGPVTIAHYARKLGIPLNLYGIVGVSIPPFLSISLGAPSLSLMELARAFSTIANYGVRTEPYFITRIEDSKGRVLEERGPVFRQVIDSTTAFIMIDMLKSVVKMGTAVSLWAKYGFDRPAAGKTGTTNEYRDSWFVGFVPQLLCGVWVGFDSLQTIFDKATGARVALPIWANYMKKATEDLPVEDFVVPSGITWATVCEASGLLATENCPQNQTYLECFKEETLPSEYCPVHKANPYRRPLALFEMGERRTVIGE